MESRTRSAPELVGGGGNNLLELAAVLASGGTVGDGNDEEGLAELVGTSRTQKERLEDLLVERSAEGREAAELDLPDEPDSIGLRGDVVALEVAVEEADLNTVGVEQSAGTGDLAKDTEGVS
jgi:hypothetical protein